MTKNSDDDLPDVQLSSAEKVRTIDSILNTVGFGTTFHAKKAGEVGFFNELAVDKEKEWKEMVRVSHDDEDLV